MTAWPGGAAVGVGGCRPPHLRESSKDRPWPNRPKRGGPRVSLRIPLT